MCAGMCAAPSTDRAQALIGAELIATTSVAEDDLQTICEVEG